MHRFMHVIMPRHTTPQLPLVRMESFMNAMSWATSPVERSPANVKPLRKNGLSYPLEIAASMARTAPEHQKWYSTPFQAADQGMQPQLSAFAKEPAASRARGGGPVRGPKGGSARRQRTPHKHTHFGPWVDENVVAAPVPMNTNSAVARNSAVTAFRLRPDMARGAMVRRVC